MQHHLDQANSNQDFHSCIEDKFSKSFFDWKITVLFYIAHHCLKALAAKKGIDIGNTHFDIQKSCANRPGAKMPISGGAWREYDNLQQYSRTARYEGITDIETFKKLMESNHVFCLKHLENFKKYVTDQGVIITEVPPEEIIEQEAAE